jgi:hypothetical protein
VVDTVNISPLHGAAVLLIDDGLDVVSVRMYNQAADRRDYTVRVEDISSSSMAPTELFGQVSAAVTNGREPWSTFSEVVAEAVGAYALLLRTKVNM